MILSGNEPLKTGVLNFVKGLISKSTTSYNDEDQQLSEHNHGSDDEENNPGDTEMSVSKDSNNNEHNDGSSPLWSTL